MIHLINTPKPKTTAGLIASIKETEERDKGIALGEKDTFVWLSNLNEDIKEASNERG
jgi:preprotein translocase subunit YajC